VVAFGAMETDFTSGVVRDNPEMNSFIASQTALGRIGVSAGCPLGTQLTAGIAYAAIRRKQMGECPEN
jgi:hypothetical protein